MKLLINLSNGFSYSVKEKKFPVDIEISTDEPVDINSRVDVTAALLTNIDAPDKSFGYVKRVMPGSREIITLVPKNPVHMRIDVLEHDGDFEDYLPGIYRCDIKVEIGKMIDKTIHSVILEESMDVELS